MRTYYKMNKNKKAYLKQDLQLFDGLLMPKGFFTIENFRQMTSYEPQSDEFVIVCYPKSGTTWTQYIVWEILNNAPPPPYVNQIMWTLCPQLEFRGTKILDQLVKKPRFDKNIINKRMLIPIKYFIKVNILLMFIILTRLQFISSF